MREQKTGCTFGARDDTRSAKNAPDLTLCGSGPVPAQPDSLGVGDQSSSGTEALMRI
jgi:hypothetical protein